MVNNMLSEQKHLKLGRILAAISIKCSKITTKQIGWSIQRRAEKH